MITPEQVAQVEKIKEGIAKSLFDCWVSGAYGDDEKKPDWTELTESKRDWLNEANSLLSTVLADLKIDTGELTDEELETCIPTEQERMDNVGVPWSILYGRKVVKAARAKFVAVGEIVKEAHNAGR